MKGEVGNVNLNQEYNAILTRPKWLCLSWFVREEGVGELYREEGGGGGLIKKKT